MNKKLSEMTLEELWQIFPIFLVKHREQWSEQYQKEKQRICSFLPKDIKRISHIGSTAVKGIWAKPIVDILVEIPLKYSLNEIKARLENGGYFAMSETEERMSFQRGYTENGFAEEVFHLHVRRVGDNDELYFGDYLNDYPQAAKEYEKLKLSLWKKYEHDRDGYTNAKTDFIKKYTDITKKEYGKRYQ